MTDTRRWYTEPETFVALAALIVSFSALGVGVYEARLQRDHDRAEVWPHLEVEVLVGTDGAKVQAENTGLGPAVVQSIDVSVDGRSQPDWPAVLKMLVPDSAARRYDDNTVFQHSLRPGDRVNLLGLPVASLPTRFWEQIGRVVVSICYRSVFDERWLVVDTLGHADQWTDAKECPSQGAKSDF
jgi:hypothetical protein